MIVYTAKKRIYSFAVIGCDLTRPPDGVIKAKFNSIMGDP
jgi:hypothetical protein